MIFSIDNIDLAPHHTFRMSLTADQWIEYTSADDIPDIMTLIGKERWMSIGGGSNLLFTMDYKGTLLHSAIKDFEANPIGGNKVMIRVGAGVNFDSFVEKCCLAGLWGVENLSGIPGDVGASAVQNIGAYGSEVKDTISSVECFDLHTGRRVELSVDKCRYEYRDSMFKQPENKKRYIVTHVNFCLFKEGRPSLGYGNLREMVEDGECADSKKVREIVMAVRESKLPSVDKIGSAGSFFKNPVVSDDAFKQIENVSLEKWGDISVPHYQTPSGIKVPAAWLIDRCGWKGYTYGNVGVWNKQPLVLVNLTGKAFPDEILTLEDNIVRSVESMFGVRLCPEVEHVGS